MGQRGQDFRRWQADVFDRPGGLGGLDYPGNVRRVAVENTITRSTEPLSVYRINWLPARSRSEDRGTENCGLTAVARGTSRRAAVSRNRPFGPRWDSP